MCSEGDRSLSHCAITARRHMLCDGECQLRIVLSELPTGPVEIYATPVRYAQLKKFGPETGHLIGAQIT